MSPFKQMLAGLGIGAAQVDTRLHTSASEPGGSLSGVIEIRGGSVAQNITELSLLVEIDYKREVNDSTVWQTYTLAHQRLSDAFMVQPNESMTFPFTLVLPSTTPLSIGHQQVKLRTKLSIPNAVDPSDSDPIIVQPHPLMQQVFDALDMLGFRLYSAECEYSRYAQSDVPFVQQFEFKPVSGYQREIEELELMFKLHAHGLDVVLEIDKRGRGLSGLFAEAYDLNERFTRLHVPLQGIDRQTLVRQLDGVIRGALTSSGFRR
jgi:sporulation-control protein